MSDQDFWIVMLMLTTTSLGWFLAKLYYVYIKQ